MKTAQTPTGHENARRISLTARLPYFYAALLFGINLAIAGKLFTTEFTQHTSSNEGSFMAISRFLVERWPNVRWFPLWSNGMPFENTYSPLLQIVDAAVSALSHCSTALAFHAVIAFFYCLGPVFLFLFAWKISELPHTGFLCALMYSLFSPSILFDGVRADAGGWHNARRLQTLVHYGEGAHNMVLSLLPLALLCACFAVTRRKYGWYVATGFLMGTLVLTNAFAAVDLGVGIVIVALNQPRTQRLRGLLLLGGIALAAYLWISPMLTPALIRTIRANSMLIGDYRYTVPVILAACAAIAGAACLWRAARRMSDYCLRFAILFAYAFLAITALAHFAHIAILPQPARYHLEMEMGLCLAFVFGARHAVLAARPWIGTGAVALFIVFLGTQALYYHAYAQSLIRPIDITGTIQYKTAAWIDSNMKGLRTMVSGDLGTWFNVFTDNPQLGAGHGPFSPNRVVDIAVYTIYTGQNAGDRDAEYSILWLKAYGCHAITVPGPNSREGYKPIRNPRKFDGVLPLLWHDEDDSIYAVPQRSKSLAHVIPSSAVIHRQPAHGLDIAEVARFVSALEDPALPLAELSWDSPARAHITGTLQPDQLVAVQVTYDPGWVATANGQPAPIARDGIGLIVVHPKCNGQCEISLVFEGGPERRLFWSLSLLTMLGAVCGGIFRMRRPPTA